MDEGVGWAKLTKLAAHPTPSALTNFEVRLGQNELVEV
jgi:hypothetical protein